MYSRPSKGSPEETIWYEVEMLDFCYRRLKTRENSWETECDFYVYLEAYLLHYRNLLACFSGEHHRSDDIDFSNLSQWTTKQVTQSQVDAIRDPAKQLEQSYYRDISQFLAHVTVRRSVEDMKWMVHGMHARVQPIAQDFLKLFPPTRQFCQGRRTGQSSLNGASTMSWTKAGGS